jgi:transcriptional regulator with XRE-family HTH domain
LETNKLERLKKFRKTLNLSQIQLSDALSLDQSYYSKVENGKIEPSILILNKLYDIYSLNIHWYLTGKGDMFYSENDRAKEYKYDENISNASDTQEHYVSTKKSSSVTPKSLHPTDDLLHLNRNDKTKGLITSKSLQVTDDLLQLNTVQSKNNILVPVAAYGGYLGEWTQEYISQDLVYIKIPGEPHQARTFEVSGDSMEPVICHGDYVVCRRCDQLNNIKIGRIYVIISALYGISVKYIYHGTGYIVMEPANLTSHQATLLDYADIKEIWEVVLRVTGDIKTTEDEPVRSRIATIEQYLYKQNPKWKGI